MKKIMSVLMIAVLGFGLVGCSCLHHKCGYGGSKSAAGSKMDKAACPACNMPGDKCKCKHGQKQTPVINTAALKILLDSGAPLIVLDARTGKYDDGRRIPGARSLGADAKDEDINAMLKSKEALIVTYCANLKCPASKALADKLRALGYTHVLEYPYGIDGWVADGNMAVTAAK